jgi:protein gp37
MMAQTTTIEWTETTWNPVRGCSRVSEGCRNCYAETLAARFSDEGNWGEGLATWVTRPDGVKEARWTGTVRAAPDHVLTAPLRWKKPRTIFVNSTSDLFHEGLPDEVIDRIFAVMALCPQHTFQVLTKRPERMRAWFCEKRPFLVADEALSVGRNLPDGYPGWDGARWKASVIRGCTQPADWPLPNVWLGTSVEDQASADARIWELINTPAVVRFISAEPLLGPVRLPRVDFHCYLCGGTGKLARWPKGRCHECDGKGHIPALSTDPKLGNPKTPMRGIDWVICGGESGPGARPMNPDWARSLRDQCAAAGVPFFMKQIDKKQPIPADLMVREWPNAT